MQLAPGFLNGLDKCWFSSMVILEAVVNVPVELSWILLRGLIFVFLSPYLYN